MNFEHFSQSPMILLVREPHRELWIDFLAGSKLFRIELKFGEMLRKSFAQNRREVYGLAWPFGETIHPALHALVKAANQRILAAMETPIR